MQLRWFIILFGLASMAQAARWETVITDPTRVLAFDVASVQKSGNGGTVWAREIFQRIEQADRGDFYFKTVRYQMQFNCDSRSSLVLLRVYYAQDGSEIRRVAKEPEERLTAVIPDTLDERKFDYACRRLFRVATPPADPIKPTALSAESMRPQDKTETTAEKPKADPVAEKSKPAAKPVAAKPVEKPVAKAEKEPEKPIKPTERKVPTKEITLKGEFVPPEKLLMDKYFGGNQAPPKAPPPIAISPRESELAQVRQIVAEMFKDNLSFVRSRNPGYFKPILDKQTPRATVVTCSDSRVHTHALDLTPDGDLFMVRNIGNQLSTAEGSVEYGVHHLHTPLLIFIGHAGCGAISAVLGDYSKESTSIKRELDSLQIRKGSSVIQGVLRNVDQQVEKAMTKFADHISAKKLVVVGAVYDFRNDLRQGFGRLVITNLNGESNPARFREDPILPQVRRTAS